MSSSVASQSKPTVLQNFGDEEAFEEVKDGQEEEVLETDEEEEIVRKSGLSECEYSMDSSAAPFLSVAMVSLNFFKGLVGAGFLGFPMAFSDAKPLYSLVLLFAISFIRFFVMSNLMKGAQYHYTRLKVPSLNFSDMAEESCKVSFGWAKNHGKLAKTIVNVTTVVHQFGVCSMYYLFIATSMGHFAVETSISETEEDFLWFGIILLPLIFINAVMTVRILSVLSLIGNKLMLFSLAFILYILFSNLGKENSVAFTGICFKTSVGGLFRACGTMIGQSYRLLSLVLPLENKVKKSSQMLGPLGVLSCRMVLSTIIYACVGVLGYFAFGDEQDGTLMDYFNCDTERAIFVLIVRLTLCLSFFSSFMLQMFFMVEMLWSHIRYCVKDVSPLVQFVFKLLLRALLVGVCFAISYALDNLGTIIRLVGVTSGTLLGFIFPALFDLFTFVPLLHSQNRVSEARARLGLNILVILFGFSMLFGGLTVNVITMFRGAPKHFCFSNATTMSMDSFATIAMTMRLNTTNS